ncbi:hypothetical protein ID853_20380, partial [Xenorhabdus sp. Vera]|uniref:hypothetical protein n=1 Tax=Xenorhabdus koppenhoeferi TaxID=351659 RepID=UPI0019926FD9
VFNGTNPNGTWNLYVVDDAVDDISSIAEGWELTITIRSLEEILQDFIAVFPFGCFCPPSEEIILGIKNILNDLVVWSTVAFISGS